MSSDHCAWVQVTAAHSCARTPILQLTAPIHMLYSRYSTLNLQQVPANASRKSGTYRCSICMLAIHCSRLLPFKKQPTYFCRNSVKHLQVLSIQRRGLSTRLMAACCRHPLVQLPAGMYATTSAAPWWLLALPRQTIFSQSLGSSTRRCMLHWRNRLI